MRTPLSHMSLRILVGAISVAPYLQTQTPETTILTFPVGDFVLDRSLELSPQLRLDVTKGGQGWMLGVYTSGSKDNLLLPVKGAAGAFPNNLNPTLQAAKAYPDLREIPIRGHEGILIVDLRGATSVLEGGKARYTGGVITLRWRGTPPRHL